MPSLRKDLFDIAVRLLVVAIVMPAGYLLPIVALHFPYDTGKVERPPLEEDTSARRFYEEVYKGEVAYGESGHDYVSFGRVTGASAVNRIDQFVERYDLRQARTLEVGAGSGQLQDIVPDYTGLDIAANAAQFFHKPFVQGSALELPFDDDSFDAIWTVFTLEHVPDPEKAMKELRRVGKPGAMVYFFPAWNCPSWAAPGYELRPYESLSWSEKVVKASLTIRSHPTFRFSYLGPIRTVRYFYSRLSNGPTRLRYTALRPNYTTYWVPDSDAVSAFDSVEAMLWFESRGDECLNCPESLSDLMFLPFGPLHIRLAGKPSANPGRNSAPAP